MSCCRHHGRNSCWRQETGSDQGKWDYCGYLRLLQYGPSYSDAGHFTDLYCGSRSFNAYLYIQSFTMCFLMFKTVLLELKCYLRVFCLQKETKKFTAFLFFLSCFSAVPYCCAETALPRLYLTSF